MRRIILIASIFLAACTNRQSASSDDSKGQTRFYDYELFIEFLNPFLGWERSYVINNDTLVISNNTYSKEGKLLKTDKFFLPMTKPQLDTIYTYAAELFVIDRENFTDMPIPRPPYGDENIARVTFDLGFRGDRYLREVRRVDTTIDNSFSRLYQFMCKTRRSR